MWLVEITLDIKTDQALAEFTDLIQSVYKDFRTLDGVVAPAMFGAAAEHVMTFAALSSEETRAEAQDKIVGALRSACHAAGAGTASWTDEAIDAAFDRSAQRTVSSEGIGNLVIHEELVPA